MVSFSKTKKFYLDQKQQRKSKNHSKFPKQIEELERKLDKNNLINIEVPDIPLEGQHGARLIPSKKPEESPERRARELEGPDSLIPYHFLNEKII